MEFLSILPGGLMSIVVEMLTVMLIYVREVIKLKREKGKRQSTN